MTYDRQKILAELKKEHPHLSTEKCEDILKQAELLDEKIQRMTFEEHKQKLLKEAKEKFPSVTDEELLDYFEQAQAMIAKDRQIVKDVVDYIEAGFIRLMLRQGTTPDVGRAIYGKERWEELMSKKHD